MLPYKLKDRRFVQDGISYYLEVFGGKVAVLDNNYDLIADAIFNSEFEDVFYQFYDSENRVTESGVNSDLYNFSCESLARWLASTHPCN